MNMRKYNIFTIIFFLSTLTSLTHATLIEINASADSALLDDQPTSNIGTNLNFTAWEAASGAKGKVSV